MPVHPQHERPKRVEERLSSENTLLELYHFIVLLFTRGANKDFPGTTGAPNSPSNSGAQSLSAMRVSRFLSRREEAQSYELVEQVLN